MIAISVVPSRVLPICYLGTDEAADGHGVEIGADRAAGREGAGALRAGGRLPGAWDQHRCVQARDAPRQELIEFIPLP